jgi:hypothetical protein
MGLLMTYHSNGDDIQWVAYLFGFYQLLTRELFVEVEKQGKGRKK